MKPIGIVGDSAWVRSLRGIIPKVAQFPSNVLIFGPSGTGKELMARAIHQCSPRANQPFVPVDCASLSGQLFASHLFGHVKGAFTGADYERIGCFRAAEGGTIFMDEVGELEPDLQSKLLRTLQERVVVPVGSDRPIPVNVRIVAATNRTLADEVQAKRFRLDLFYRLSVIDLETMALRDRVDDIEPLASFFLTKMAADHGYPAKRLTASAIAALKAYSWPGNVRQLQNVLERAAVLATGELLDADAFPKDAEQTARSQTVAEPAPSSGVPSWPSLSDMEREHIVATLAARGAISERRGESAEDQSRDADCARSKSISSLCPRPAPAARANRLAAFRTRRADLVAVHLAVSPAASLPDYLIATVRDGRHAPVR